MNTIKKKRRLHWIIIVVVSVLFVYADSIFKNNLLFIDLNENRIYDCNEKEYVKNNNFNLDSSANNNPVYNFQFIKIWQKDTSSGGLLDVAIDDLNNNGYNNIVTFSHDSMSLTIYENDNDNSFNKIWESDSNEFSYFPIKTCDIDNNNYENIICGNVVEINIFESKGNNLFAEKSRINIDNDVDIRFKDLIIADVNNDRKNEIVFIRSKPVTKNHFAIYEDTQNIFEDKSSGYWVDLAVGGVDPDTFPDIFVCHGGWGNEDLWLDYFEFQGYVFQKKKITFTGTTGLPMTAEVGDIDCDGINELVVGGEINGKTQLLVIKATGNDQYAIVDSIWFGPNASTSPMGISIKNILGDEYPEIAVCTHYTYTYAQVYLFNYRNNKLEKIYESGPDLLPDLDKTVFYNIYLCYADKDTLPDILLAAGGLNRGAILLEYQPITSIENNAHINQIPPKLSIKQSPSNNTIKITYTTNKNSPVQLDVYTLQGKKLRTIVNGFKHTGSHEVIWDGRSDSGAKVGNGCYLIRLVCGKEEVTRRVMMMR